MTGDGHINPFLYSVLCVRLSLLVGVNAAELKAAWRQSELRLLC